MEMNFSALFLDTTPLVSFNTHQCGKDHHIYTFTSDVGEIFHIFVPCTKHFRSRCHHFLKLGVVHVHQSLRAEDFEKLVIEV